MSLNTKSFEYEGKRYEKILVVGFTGIGKTLFLTYISRDYRFNNISMADDAWTSISRGWGQSLFEKNHILASQVIEDFSLHLKSDYLVLDLNLIVGLNKDFSHKQKVLRDLVKKIDYTEVKKPLYQLCTCSITELMNKGCKCGGVKPYVFKY